MRRSICYCEPAYSIAGEQNTWKFIYTTSVNLPKGTKIKFDLNSKGRSIDWETPSVNPKDGKNVIYGLTENNKVVNAKSVNSPHSIVPQFEFILPQELPAEHSFTIVIGSPKLEPASLRKNGNLAQTLAQRRRSFLLYVDPTGKGHYDEPEVFTMDVKGDKLHLIKIMVPSFVSKNKRFDVVVRFEDEYGNLTSNAHEDTLIEFQHENLRENLNWKLFVPETGYLSLPNLYFNEPGVYTVVLKNHHTKEDFKAAPIKCFNETEMNLFWGSLHGESERYDSTENVESCLRHFRDEQGYSFYGVSPFENAEETPNEIWKQIVQNVSDFNEAERFTTFSGLQWPGAPGTEGIQNLLFTKEVKTLPRKKDNKFGSIVKYARTMLPKETMVIPSFTMGEGYSFNFKDFDPQYHRVVEIYNAWGSSECMPKEGNTRPIKSTGKTGIGMAAEGSIKKALQRNLRFGFVAGGLDDRGIYADLYDSDQVQYSPGLTAIVAKEHSQASLYDALYNRSCFATTGPRMIVGINIAGTPMGGEISTAEKPGLKVNRHITGYAVGTTKLDKVEIIRNGEVYKTLTSDTYHLEFAIDDMDPINKVVLTSPDKKPPFVYYYLRVTQEDGNIAWSSPIWIDDEPAIPGKGRKLIKPLPKTLPTVKSNKEEAADDFDDDFNDDDDEDDLE